MKVLLVKNDEEKFKVANILNGLCTKIDNKRTIDEPIRLSYEETELLREIYVGVKM